MDVEGSAFFSKQVIDTVTRGNDAKLYKIRVYSAREGNYFSNRVINLWNSLPNHAVSASSVSAFKRKLQNLKLPLFITQTTLQEYFFLILHVLLLFVTCV